MSVFVGCAGWLGVCVWLIGWLVGWLVQLAAVADWLTLSVGWFGWVGWLIPAWLGYVWVMSGGQKRFGWFVGLLVGSLRWLQR